MQVHHSSPSRTPNRILGPAARSQDGPGPGEPESPGDDLTLLGGLIAARQGVWPEFTPGTAPGWQPPPAPPRSGRPVERLRVGCWGLPSPGRPFSGHFLEPEWGD